MLLLLEIVMLLDITIQRRAQQRTTRQRTVLFWGRSNSSATLYWESGVKLPRCFDATSPINFVDMSSALSSSFASSVESVSTTNDNVNADASTV